MLCWLRNVTIVLSMSLFCLSISYADITLPTPQMKDGMGLFDSLKKRASTPGGGFPTGMVSDDALSSVLSSATGLNRDKGAFLYEWEGHYLREITKQDIRADIGMQNFTKRAPYIVIFVADGASLNDFDAQKANDFSQIAVGAMSQNVYLSAAALKLSTRYIHSIKPDIISQSLQLPESSKPIGIMLLAK